MTKFVLGLLLIGAAMYAAACAYLYFQQRSLIYFPTPATQAEGAQHFILESAGEKLKVWRIGPASENAAIFFGGNAQDVAAFIPILGEALPNHTVYLLNYRGYGGSTGAASEAAFFTDALALFEVVRPRHARVAVIGQSLGSGVAAYLASQRDLAKLVLITPYDSIEKLAQKNFPLFPVALLLKDKFDSASRVPAIKASTLVILAEFDEVIPRANSQALIAAFGARRPRVEVVPGTDHNSVCVADACQRMLRSFLSAPQSRM